MIHSGCKFSWQSYIDSLYLSSYDHFIKSDQGEEFLHLLFTSYLHFSHLPALCEFSCSYSLILMSWFTHVFIYILGICHALLCTVARFTLWSTQLNVCKIYPILCCYLSLDDNQCKDAIILVFLSSIDNKI